MFVRLVTLAAGLSAATSAMAQDYERVAPRLPASPATPVIAAPAAPVAVADDARQVVPELKGLLFFAAADQIVPGGVGVSGVGGIDVSRVPALDDPALVAKLAPFIGKPLTLGDLDRVRAIVLDWQRAHRRPFVDVAAPPQNVSSGVVQIVVTQYRLGKVSVEGARHFRPTVVERLSGFEPGEPLTLDGVRGDMDLANQNPFLTVDAVFQPGATPGETDVVLQAKDRLPWRAYAGYDNNGLTSLGVGEVFAGVNWGNAFGEGQVLSYQYTRAISGHFQAHSASYVVPLPWKDRLLVYGSYQIADPRLPEIFHSHGTSGQASARYVHFLPRSGGLTQDVQLGYDFKTTNTNLDFAGFNVFAARAEVHQFSLTYDATLSDRLGQTTIQNLLFASPGNMTGRNTTALLSLFVPYAKANYLYDRLLVTRTTKLPANLVSITRATAQLATGNLPNSEQLGGGGPGSVRGYHPDTALGSKGVILSQEFRLPPFGLTDSKSGNGQVQLGAFVDYARLRQIDAIPYQDNRPDMLSIGTNAHASFSRYMDVQVDLGWRLKRTLTEPTRGAFASVSATVGF